MTVIKHATASTVWDPHSQRDNSAGKSTMQGSMLRLQQLQWPHPRLCDKHADRPQVGEAGTVKTLQPTHYAVQNQQQNSGCQWDSCSTSGVITGQDEHSDCTLKLFLFTHPEELESSSILADCINIPGNIPARSEQLHRGSASILTLEALIPT